MVLKYLLRHTRRSPSLIPLFGAYGFGIGMAVTFTLRMATQNPDVSWRRKTNPEPWQKLVDEQGNRRRWKFFQFHPFPPFPPFHPSIHPSYPAGFGIPTVYGIPNFPDERPPIEKMWAEYQAEHPCPAHVH